MRPTAELVLLSVAGVAALAAAIWIVYSGSRQTGDPEARRRELIDAHGRIIEGTITDYSEGVVYFAWSWGGVDYESCQDLSCYRNRLPSPESMVGPVSVKFLSKTPSNSIVMSDKWSGFSTPAAPERPASTGTSDQAVLQ